MKMPAAVEKQVLKWGLFALEVSLSPTHLSRRTCTLLDSTVVPFGYLKTGSKTLGFCIGTSTNSPSQALTMVFWLSGFLALAVFLSDRICFGTVCQVAKAGTAIAAFQWVAWMVTLIFAGIKIFRRGGATTPMLIDPKVEVHQYV
jgi:hypothetical protein